MKLKNLILPILVLMGSPAMSQRKLVSYERTTMNGKKTGIIDGTTGDTLLRAKYDAVKSYSGDGYFTVVIEDRWGIVDSTGKEIIPIKYSYCTSLKEERAFVVNEGGAALIDRSGKLLTGYIFEDAKNFSGGMAKVRMNGLYGFIDRAGKIVIPCQYKTAADFVDGVTVVTTNKWYSYGQYVYEQHSIQGQVKKTNIDAGTNKTYPYILSKEGKVLYKGEGSERIEKIGDGYILCSKFDMGENRSQMLDMGCQPLVPYSKSLSLEVGENWLISQSLSNRRFGIVDYKGRELLKPNFASIRGVKVEGKTYWQVYFDYDGKNFFYIDADAKCVELEGRKCPDAN